MRGCAHFASQLSEVSICVRLMLHPSLEGTADAYACDAEPFSGDLNQ